MTTHIIESAFTTSACDFGRSLEHIRPFRETKVTVKLT